MDGEELTNIAKETLEVIYKKKYNNKASAEVNIVDLIIKPIINDK